MKVSGAIAGLLIVGVVGFLLYPRIAGPAAPPANARTGASAPESNGQPPSPNRPLDAPRTAEEDVREDYSRKRLPFFRFLRENYGQVIQRFAVTESIDTLDLQVTVTDDESLRRIVSEAVSPTAKQYGFRKVRLFVANPPGNPDPVALIAESTFDDAGRWNTFRK